jgi:hypothetical protein
MAPSCSGRLPNIPVTWQVAARARAVLHRDRLAEHLLG